MSVNTVRTFIILIHVFSLSWSLAYGAKPDSISAIEFKPFRIEIGRVHSALSGQSAYVSVSKAAGSEPIRTFNLLVDYDTSRMQFVSGKIGAALSDKGCRWRYFTCGLETVDTCTGQCPRGLVRIRAAADSIGKETSAGCYVIPDGGELASVEFMVRNLADCEFLPIRFVWGSCSDNTLTTVRKRQPLAADSVLDWNYDLKYSANRTLLTGQGANFCFSYGGIPSNCRQKEKTPESHAGITFRNGGLDFVCGGDPTALGDINLNGIANEISDESLLANYLLQGLSTLSDSAKNETLAMSDMNDDGQPLTVADLVYLQRLITGDAKPIARLNSMGDAVTVNFANEVLSTKSLAKIAGVFATFASDRDYQVESQCNLPLSTYYDSTTRELRVLQFCLVGRDKSCFLRCLGPGDNSLFRILGQVTLKSIQFSDYDGNLLIASLGDQHVPLSFALECSVNPFRSDRVRINLGLPEKTDWRIEISNARQQILKTYSGTDAGTKYFDWIWADYLPGVYTVKAIAGASSLARQIAK